MRRPTSRRLATLAIAASAVFGMLSACSDDASTDDSLAAVPFTASDGQPTTLADLRGSPLVVNLWATWCTPCVKEMPVFDAVADDLSGTVHVIGVNVGDSAADATSFAEGLGVGYDLFTDPDGALMTALDVSGLPATAFITADGTLLTVHQGAYSEAELRAAIAEHFPTTGATTP